jgi:hypothetical protein
MRTPFLEHLRQPLGIIAVGLVELHAQRRSSMPRVKADHVETSRAELMNDRTSLNADPRPRASMLQHRPHNLLGRRNALAPPLAMAFTIDNAERRGLL